MVTRLRIPLLVLLIAGAALTVACGGPIEPSPALSCPVSRTVASADGNPVVVTYPLPSVFGGRPPTTTTCTPSSGSAFPVGSTTVTCTAVDARQQTGACTFVVTVTAPPRIAATRFLAFGDSITQGKLSSDVITPNSYPAQLQASLASRFTAQILIVINEGCGGETAEEVAHGTCPGSGGVVRLPETLSLDRPQVLLLMEGANDLMSGDPATVSPMADALATMVGDAQESGVQVFLATLPPERSGGLRAGASALITTANDRIRQLATSAGVTLVDVYQAMGGSPDPYIGDDGLHPTEAGYTKIAQTFFNAIVAALESPSAGIRALLLTPPRGARRQWPERPE